MKILVDTREQVPLEFDHPYITSVERATLSVGDYMVRFEDGYSPPICFERKSIADLFGTMGKGYKRFKREMMRAQEQEVKLIVIVEGCLSKVVRGYEHSTIEGVSLVMKLFTLRWRYGLETVFCRDRDDMSLYVTEAFLGLGREYVRRKKGK